MSVQYQRAITALLQKSTAYFTCYYQINTNGADLWDSTLQLVTFDHINLDHMIN